jgi:putative ABC transport system permease protein
MLWRASVRHLLRHPWQAGLSILGVALGVAVVLSIDLANESARRSFAVFTGTVAGRATHQIVGGPSGVPESLYRVLRVEAGVRAAAPVVEREVAAPDLPGRTFHLMGVDPFAEAPFRAFVAAGGPAGEGGVRSLADLAAFLTRPATALVSRDTARELGIGRDGALVVRLGGVRHRLSVIGELVPRDAFSARAIENLLVVDVATAQELVGAPGVLSRIDLVVPEGAAGGALLARVQARLPPGARVVAAGARSEATLQMTRAFALNLSALSLLALVVGLFLIYNTVTFSVVQRRGLIGALRALGVTRREVFAVVLVEALVVGVIATALGLPLGVALGRGLVRLVTRTINDLYVVLAVRDLALAPWALAKAAALGMAGTVLAAVAPAREATTTPPRLALSRSAIESRTRAATPALALAGVAVAALGGAALLLPVRSIAAGYAALFTVLLGAALLTPGVTVALMALLRPMLGRVFGVFGRLAAGAVVGALSRTAVALAALMVAIAATVGVGVMIGSFRQTVVRWLAASLPADVYVSAPSLVGNRPDATLDPVLVDRVRRAAGVARVNTARGVRVESPQGALALVALDIDARGRAGFTFKRGDPAAIWPALERGEAVVVSEPLAYHRRLGLGSRLALLTDRGLRTLAVAGIFYDYGSSEGAVMMDRRAYERLWDDRQISSLAVYAEPGVDVDTLVASVRGAAGSDQEVLVRATRALREASLEIFDRTFAVTVVLRLLATIVAFVGVLSALMALSLERSRELGVLRAQGVTPGEVRLLVTAQTGLMGLVAGLLAIPVGLALAAILVFVINQRSFGWTLQLEVAPAVLAQALALAVGAAVLAGLYPGWRMARLSLPAALRDE